MDADSNDLEAKDSKKQHEKIAPQKANSSLHCSISLQILRRSTVRPPTKAGKAERQAVNTSVQRIDVAEIGMGNYDRRLRESFPGVMDYGQVKTITVSKQVCFSFTVTWGARLWKPYGQDFTCVALLVRHKMWKQRTFRYYFRSSFVQLGSSQLLPYHHTVERWQISCKPSIRCHLIFLCM